MKKIIRIFLLLFLCLLLLSALGCPAPDNGNEDDGKIYHTVSYCHDNDHDGIYDTVSERHRVEDGKPAPLHSADPLGYAYRQGSWCYVREDGTLGDAYSGEPITEDTRLMVKWEPNTYAITYDLGGPYVGIDLNYGEKIPFETIDSLKAKLPEGLREKVDAWLEYQTQDGRVFLYWASEGVEWNFDEDTVMGHTTLVPVFGLPATD